MEALAQIKQRFSSEDSLFDLLENALNLTKAQKFKVKDLTCVIKRFANIVTDEKNLNKEWNKHASLDFIELTISPEYCYNILKLTDSTGEPMFPNLKEIIMVLPFSNACMERVTKYAKNATTFEPSKTLAC
ncbi:hypothetical protein WA026_017363 [Henosepilachna vigintioctopunctata]|uniref:Uncharacterized protein n=1 Tax=Henosepilachna vigintioctopunctata TaxID=420089 RepID=A0AAW1VFV2_9CUCU